MVSKHSGCVDHTGTATNKFTHFRILVISGSWAYSIYHYCHKINCQIWFPITIFTSSPPSRGCGISRPPSRRRSRKALMAQRWNHSLHFFAAGDTAKNLSHLLVYVCMYYVCLLYIYILYIYISGSMVTFHSPEMRKRVILGWLLLITITLKCHGEIVMTHPAILGASHGVMVALSWSVSDPLEPNKTRSLVMFFGAGQHRIAWKIIFLNKWR